jgi:4-carboxymuconolactone decarboxylase
MAESDREVGLRVFKEILPQLAGAMSKADAPAAPAFGAELGDLALTNVFGRLWGREGLDRRARSLVTLGILIALRSTDELRIHFDIARTNGLTDTELEEVIYHASGYAGFPAAASAMTIAASVLGEEAATD